MEGCPREEAAGGEDDGRCAYRSLSTMTCRLEGAGDGGEPVQRCERVVQRWRHCVGAPEPELVEEKKEEFTRTADEAMRGLEHLEGDFGRFSIFPNVFGRGRREGLDGADADEVHRLFGDEPRASPAAERPRAFLELRELRSAGGDWPLSSLLSELLTPSWVSDVRRRPPGRRGEEGGSEGGR